MFRIWAISDLHLGFSTGKWMDRFGDHWKGHHLKVESAWRERIEPGDLVLLPGDFSWAMKPGEVAEDFRWLAQLPGRKVLVKGNHDYWWPSSRKKLAEVLPDDVHALKKTAVVVDGVPRARVSLPTDEEFRVEELAKGRWKVNARWNSQPLLKDVLVDLEDETALLISLPKAAMLGGSALFKPARR